jgi:hypothetical protein
MRWRARSAIAITVLLAGSDLVLTGCDLMFGLDHLDDRDAGGDGPTVDATCLGSGLISQLCAAGGGAVTLTTAINTTIDGRCRKVPQDIGPTLCVIDGETIVVSEYVRVTGDSPLVLLATKSIAITALLDASSGASRVGAGAQLGCASMVGTNGGTGAGGGGGGSFGFIGGVGGFGQMGMFQTSPGGTGTAVVPQMGVYGGCGGGAGGIIMGGTAAAPGAGGGAIYVIAGDRIDIAATGSINASGAAGAGGGKGGGGAGGGAGGFIAIDAPTLVIEGAVFARGGGGGGGGGSTTAGGPGTEPTTATVQTPGGVAGTTGGGNGGAGCGAPLGTIGGQAMAAPYGGGGGGGACGRIRLYGTSTITGPINPDPT